MIINMKSVMAILALTDQVPCCAAKGGAHQPMVSALSDCGIQVNPIGPGPVLTDLMKRVVYNKNKEGELLARMPQGRVAECREIATVAFFMAGDESGFFTGQCVYPYGGRMIQACSRKLEEQAKCRE